MTGAMSSDWRLSAIFSQRHISLPPLIRLNAVELAPPTTDPRLRKVRAFQSRCRKLGTR
jgi:hypothetical protein